MASSSLNVARSVKLKLVPQPPLVSSKIVHIKITEHANDKSFIGDVKRHYNLDSIPYSDVTLKDGDCDYSPFSALGEFLDYCKQGKGMSFEKCTAGEHIAEVELGISTLCPIGTQQHRHHRVHWQT